MKTVVEHLADLIRIPSVSRLSNRPIVEYAEHALHLAGWQTKQHSYQDMHGVEKVNLIAAPAGRTSTTSMYRSPSCATPTPFHLHLTGLER